MSKRTQRREANDAASKVVRQHIDPLVASALGTPLPQDILIVAAEWYDGGYCLPVQLVRAQKRVERVIKSGLPDVLIISGRRRSVSRRRDACASLVLLPKAVPTRGDRHFVGMYTFAFGFWKDRMLFLTATEPGVVSTHLHQRIVQRSSAAFSSLAQAQDRFSDLWPCLFELGKRRREAGRRGNVSNFVSPWADGLMFGDFARIDLPPEALALSSPVLFDYDPKRREIHKNDLRDWYRRGDERLGYNLRTYIGPAELLPHQAELHSRLLQFCAQHKRVTVYLKNVSRLAVGSSGGAGEELADILGMPMPTSEENEQAIAALEELSSSDLWLSEVARSKKTRERTKKEQ